MAYPLSHNMLAALKRYQSKRFYFIECDRLILLCGFATLVTPFALLKRFEMKPTTAGEKVNIKQYKL